MNIKDRPELLDRLAASYALGTLRGSARKRFEAMARDSVTIRVAVITWHERMSGMTELESGVTPPAYVWTRISNALELERAGVQKQAMAASQALGAEGFVLNELTLKLRKALTWWRGAALVGGLATAAAVMIGVAVTKSRDDQIQLQNAQLSAARSQMAQAGSDLSQVKAQLEAAPQIQYVAVLADDKASASILVTFDPKTRRLTLKRVGTYQEGDDKSLQLWALPTAGGPQSLGVLSRDAVVRLATGQEQIQQVPTLAISLEPKGGVPSAGGPTGPVLFKGALIQTPI